jgi:hypothetical protein
MRLLISTVGMILLTLAAQRAGAQNLIPPVPNSSQRVTLYIPDRNCGGVFVYKANPYTVTQSQNKITVQLEDKQPRVPGGGGAGVCPPGPFLPIDLGVFLPGQYSFSVFEKDEFGRNRPVGEEFPFTVTDARKTKVAPYPAQDVSGTWWDSSDPGWGLFIWHNSASPKDELFAAWFVYGTDGKPIWYTFSPEWRSSTATKEGPLYQSSRPPGNGVPPPGFSTHTPIGTASLDFTYMPFRSALPDIPSFTKMNTAILKYKIGSGETVTRTVERFAP